MLPPLKAAVASAGARNTGSMSRKVKPTVARALMVTLWALDPLPKATFLPLSSARVLIGELRGTSTACGDEGVAAAYTRFDPPAWAKIGGVSPTEPASMAPAPRASSMGGPNWNSTHFTDSTPKALRRCSITPCLRASTWMAEPFCHPRRTSLGKPLAGACALADGAAPHNRGLAVAARVAAKCRRFSDLGVMEVFVFGCQQRRQRRQPQAPCRMTFLPDLMRNPTKQSYTKRAFLFYECVLLFFLRSLLCGLRLPIRPLSLPAAGSITALMRVGLPESMALFTARFSSSGVVALTPTPPKASIILS